jgi:hypothetical protein
MTLHPAYAATRISSNLKGSTKQSGWLQAPATIRIDEFLNACWCVGPAQLVRRQCSLFPTFHGINSGLPTIQSGCRIEC